MNDTILSELNRAGVHVEMDGEHLRLKGPPAAVTPELVAKVKKHKAEILQALMPSMSAPLRHTPVKLTADQADQVCNLMDGEPIRAVGWVLGANGRADEYEADRGWTPRDCDLTAATDWLMLRRGLDHMDDHAVVRMLADFYCSRSRGERLAMHKRSLKLHEETGATHPACDVAAYGEAWTAAGRPSGPYPLAADGLAQREPTP